MTAVEERIASKDPIKRMTFQYQYWLAVYRYYGGESSSEDARYIRQQLKRIRMEYDPPSDYPQLVHPNDPPAVSRFDSDVNGGGLRPKHWWNIKYKKS